MNITVLRSVRLAIASLLATGLAAQLFIGMADAGLTVVRFLSFFTVLSNLAAVLVLMLLAITPDRDRNRGFATFRGAVTVYMSVTGIVWAVILAPNYTDVGVPEPWIDVVIHLIGPIFMLTDWFVNPPPVRLSKSVFGIWLIFPVIYLTYSLVRGAIVDWYPYPFLDPRQGGYGEVATGSVIVLIVITLFSALYWWWAGRAQRHP